MNRQYLNSNPPIKVIMMPITCKKVEFFSKSIMANPIETACLTFPATVIVNAEVNLLAEKLDQLRRKAINPLINKCIVHVKKSELLFLNLFVIRPISPEIRAMTAQPKKEVIEV